MARRAGAGGDGDAVSIHHGPETWREQALAEGI